MQVSETNTPEKTKQRRKQIAYLFGAGATHAELANLFAKRMSDATFQERNSLLLADVSKRVCREAKRDRDFSKTIHNLLSPSGLSNIELFISLLEKNRIKSTEEIVQSLKRRIKKDILARLRHRQKDFYLHKALFEFHKLNKDEELTGLISLNYDHLLDDAYEVVLRKKPNYCLSQGPEGVLPLLKLHGGFDLTYRKKKLPIITPGVNKNYLELPYNFIWGRALELLIDSEVLRVIGCSLSQNDLGIVDLLFKAHVNKNEPLVLQLIDFDPKDNRVKENFGFFPDIQRALEIDGGLISDAKIQDPFAGSNPFKIWLKAKIERTMKKAEIEKTTYIKRVLE
jgi:hypothetical protein